MTSLLKFSIGNAKLDRDTAIFSIPAGYTCPGAKDCLSFSDKVTGKIKDGEGIKFRCYAASLESAFSSVRKNHHYNWELLKAAKTELKMASLILKSIPRNQRVKYVRVHDSGDFYNMTYFKAWMVVARSRPDLLFYAYTKSLRFWAANVSSIPENFKLVASAGGKFDSLIEEHGFHQTEVVFHPDEAKEKGLEIDHDDKHARAADHSFALLGHGVQPKGSEAAEKQSQLRKEGIIFNYARR